MALLADGTIRWRIHLRSAPAAVYDLLATDAGRQRFWARRSVERGDALRLEFANGQAVDCTLLERAPAQRFVLTYFAGSRVSFALAPDGAGGTDLELVERGVPEDERLDNLAGWVSVLLVLKAAADFGFDLRNDDAAKRWEDDYVDV